MITRIIDFYREEWAAMSADQWNAYFWFVAIVGGVVFPMLMMGLARSLGFFRKGQPQ